LNCYNLIIFSHTLLCLTLLHCLTSLLISKIFYNDLYHFLIFYSHFWLYITFTSLKEIEVSVLSPLTTIIIIIIIISSSSSSSINTIIIMTHRSAVGLGTMLQARRSRVRFTMRSLHFSINLILPASLRPWD
jgi:hypothetical protein